jgi:hypothetical protein
MMTQVEFRSAKFPAYEGEEDQINPGVWGKRLADYLAAGLTDRGWQIEAIVAEDWGWYVPLKNEGFRLAVCCGHQDGDEDEFLIFTDPSRPSVRKGFKKVDATPQLTRLTKTLQDILQSDPDITEVVWTDV